MRKHEWVRSEVLGRLAGSAPDTRLPEERELAEEFGVSRATVRQALAALVNEGKVYAIRGRGTFVAPDSISKGLRLRSFSDDMRSRGLEPATHLLLAEAITADPEVSALLDLAPGASVIHLERLRRAAGIPMCVESVWLPASLCPHLLSEDLEQSLYELLSARYGIEIRTANERIAAAVMNDAARGLLSMPNPSAAMVITRRSFDQAGRAIEFARTTYRADRYSFDVSIKR